MKKKTKKVVKAWAALNTKGEIRYAAIDENQVRFHKSYFGSLLWVVVPCEIHYKI